jgi:hypothetical protein
MTDHVVSGLIEKRRELAASLISYNASLISTGPI